MGIFNFVSDLQEALQGYKTYIVALIVGVVAGLEAFGIDVPLETVKLLGLAGIGAGARSAIKEIRATINESDLPVEE